MVIGRRFFLACLTGACLFMPMRYFRGKNAPRNLAMDAMQHMRYPGPVRKLNIDHILRMSKWVG